MQVISRTLARATAGDWHLVVHRKLLEGPAHQPTLHNNVDSVLGRVDQHPEIRRDSGATVVPLQLFGGTLGGSVDPL